MRRPETITFWRGRLPHWEVVDGRYFLTLHLVGAIPKQGQERIRTIASALDRISKSNTKSRLEIHRRIFAEMEAWLDSAQDVSLLSNPAIATMVRESLAHRQGRDWNVFEYVLMPNHLHIFCELLREGLKTIVEQFKRWTGHEASKLIDLPAERFWQDEWFDHWSRSDEEDEKIIEYIRRNPVKAGLVEDYRKWPYGSWGRS